MSEERLAKILLAPVISEKSSNLADHSNQFVFKVVKDADKCEIKKAVELMFKVEVDAVQTSNVKGKTKRFGGRLGQRVNWKKAYITLKPGNDIELFGPQ
ncbi:MAG: 50S ribosomal protein L23 [Gammaproteobacteria bacterium]|nr:50S ribosomal protein L23 [Gammaproteobacteria bacterium]